MIGLPCYLCHQQGDSTQISEAFLNQIKFIRRLRKDKANIKSKVERDRSAALLKIQQWEKDVQKKKRELDVIEEILVDSLKSPPKKLKPKVIPKKPLEYNCSACTLLNNLDQSTCRMCGSRRPFQYVSLLKNIRLY